MVTQTGATVTSQVEWSRARNQQRNWETINQIISLRCLPENITNSVEQDHLWSFEFYIPSLSAVSTADDPLGFLKADADQVPMITGLDEQHIKLEYLLPGTNVWFDLIES
jgi:hypothetical protein